MSIQTISSNPRQKRRAVSSRRLLLVAATALLLSATVSSAAGRGPRPSIAVTRFSLKSDLASYYGSTDVGGGLSAMLTTALLQNGRFTVVERPDLDSVLEEQRLSASGLTTTESAVAGGRLIAASLQITGHVTEFSLQEKGGGTSIGTGRVIKGIPIGLGFGGRSKTGVVGMDLKVVDTTTGETVAAVDVREQVKSKAKVIDLRVDRLALQHDSFQQTPLGKAARAAVDKAVEKLSEALADVSWTARVVDFEAGELVINAGADSGLSPGDSFVVQSLGRTYTDPVTGRVLGQRKQIIGVVHIESTDANLAFGRFEAHSKRAPKRGDLVAEL